MSKVHYIDVGIDEIAIKLIERDGPLDLLVLFTDEQVSDDGYSPPSTFKIQGKNAIERLRDALDKVYPRLRVVSSSPSPVSTSNTVHPLGH